MDIFWSNSSYSYELIKMHRENFLVACSEESSLETSSFLSLALNGWSLLHDLENQNLFWIVFIDSNEWNCLFLIYFYIHSFDYFPSRHEELNSNLITTYICFKHLTRSSSFIWWYILKLLLLSISLHLLWNEKWLRWVYCLELI